MATTSPPRPKPALFLLDSDDEDAPVLSRHRRVPQPAPPPPEDFDIDALFADIPDDEVNPPMELDSDQFSIEALDVGAMERAAEARARKSAPSATPLTPHQVLPSSSPPRDEPSGVQRRNDGDAEPNKKRRKRIRLDENRLLGSDGFPALIQMTKGFKVTGKGHEANDLDRLLQVYQFWGHKLHPPTQFRDTVERVEKLCHSKLMNSALSRWRDEAHGKTPVFDDVDISDGEHNTGNNDSPSFPSPHQLSNQSGIDVASGDLRSSPPPTSPSEPASASAFDDDDFDIDAIIREEDERQARLRAATQDVDMTKSTEKRTDKDVNGDSQGDAEDDGLWGAIMSGAFDVPVAPAPGSNSNGANKPQNSTKAPTVGTIASFDHEEEMWDMVRELEQDGASAAPRQSPIDTEQSNVSNSKADISVAEEDWEDMYL